MLINIYSLLATVGIVITHLALIAGGTEISGAGFAEQGAEMASGAVTVLFFSVGAEFLVVLVDFFWKNWVVDFASESALH